MIMPSTSFTARTAQRAVAAGAGENDADGALALILRQRTEEGIDGQMEPMGYHRVDQVQVSMKQGQVFPGGNDIDVVGRDGDAVGDLRHRHPGEALHQLTEETFVVRREVLHQHKCHVGAGSRWADA